MLKIYKAEDGVLVETQKIEPIDEETENYLSVEDETILNTVYEMFKEKYSDVLTFED